MKLCLVLLALALVAQASGTRDAADVQARSVPYLAVPGDRHGLPDWCHVQCYGDNSTKHGESYECWGTFKVWCAKDTRQTAAAPAVAHDDDYPARFFGFFCKGHFLSTHVEDGDRRLVLCEGGSSSIRGRIARCPYTRKTYRNMEGSWNLGTASSLMTHPHHDNDTDTDNDSRTASPAAGVQQLLRDMDMDELVQQLRKNVAAAASDAGNDTDTEYSFEGRGQGLSGEWRATKVISEDEYAAGALTAEQAQAVEREMIDPQWADWMPKSLSTGGCNKNKPGNSNGVQGGGSHHGDYEVTCNGRPAWLRGAAPCWGKFEVSGEWRRDESAATRATADSMTTATAPTARRALRQLVAGQLGAEKTMRHDVPATTTTADAASSEAAGVTKPTTTPRLGYDLNSASMDAECDGLWSGALGRTCYGLNTAHLELEGGWGKLSKWSICSGKQGIRFMRRENAWGMSTACKGRAVAHVSIMPNDDDDDDDDQRA